MTVRIAIVTDTHVCGAAKAFNANAVAAVDWINGAGVDLVVHLGDVSADGVQAPGQFAAAQQIFARLAPPARFIPGNHDIGDNPADAEPTHEPLVEPGMLESYRAVFGDDRWVVTPPGWTLIGLNSQLFGRGDELEDDQFAWLAAALASAAGPVGLFAHKPLFREAPDDGHVNPRYTPALARRRLMDLLAPRDWRFVISGHVHQWRRHTFAGVDHVWAPSTAFVVPDVIQDTIGEKRLGCLLLELGRDAHCVSLQRPPGIQPTSSKDLAVVYPQLEAMLAERAAAASR